MFYQCLLGVVTHKKCDETRVPSSPFLAWPSQGLATWLVKLPLQSWRCSQNLVPWHVLVKFSVLKYKNQPEETKKMCRKGNSRKGTLEWKTLGGGGGGCKSKSLCSRFSLHHYVILPFMESVGHVLPEIKQSSSGCWDRVGAVCFRVFSNRYKSGGEPKIPKWPP